MLSLSQPARQGFLIISSFVSVLLLAGCASTGSAVSGPPAPPPESAREYYPLMMGWKWAYDIERDNDRILAIYSVLQRDGETAVVQAGNEQMTYSVRDDGIARVEGGRIADFVLKSPIKQGAEWMISEGHARIVSVGQSVTVPAGTFPNCAVVEEVRTNPERVVKTTFAAGVGLVSLEAQLHDQATGKFQVVVRASLRGITRPGEDPLGR